MPTQNYNLVINTDFDGVPRNKRFEEK